MNKFKIASVVLGAAMLIAPFAASASTISSVQFSNGDTTISCVGGSTVNATFQVTIPQNEVVEYVRTAVGGQPFVDTSVGSSLGYQEGVQNIQASVKCPPNTGYYNLDIQTAGTFGGQRSVSGADGVNGSASYGSAIRVVASGDTSVGGTPSGIPADVWAKFLAFISGTVTPPAPTVSPLCAEIGQYSTGLYIGSTGSQVVSLQGYLLSKDPNSIPLIRDGAAKFGYYGMQTNAAVAAFKVAHNCN